MVAASSYLRSFASNRLIRNGGPKKRPRQNFRAAQFREEMRRWERRVKRGREDVLFTTVYCIAQGIWQDVEAKKIAPLIRTGHMASGDMTKPARESSSARRRALLIRAAAVLICQGTVMAEHQETKDNGLIWVTIGTLVVGVVVILILNSIIGV